MSEPAGPVVRLARVGKMYKVFPSRAGILLDAVGLARRGSYREFWALRGFDLELSRGQRVGLIGRNGAGKSTVLRLVTQAIHPTEGEIRVDGRVHALLETSGGLHPEFSGHDNIRASLEALGLDPHAVQAAGEEIAEFTELGRFLEQPFKTYSLGMQSRLAFAIATAVEPEILIVDEVLGAGDAYFFGKAIARMQRLIDSGAAVLIVSHALDQIIRFCDEAIWLDRGRIVMRAPSTEVVKAYERFTRELEDRRLRARNRKALLGRYDAFERESVTDHLEVRVAPGAAGDGTCDVSELRLLRDGSPEDAVRVGDAQDADESQSAWVALADGGWSAPREEGGRYFRSASGPQGGTAIFALWFFYPGSEYAVEVTYRSTGEPPVLRAARGGEPEREHALPPAPEWRTERVVVARGEAAATAPPGRAGGEVRWPGEGSIRIEHVELLGEGGREQAVFPVGTPLTVRLRARAAETGRFPIVPALSLYRADGILASNHPGERLELDLREGDTFELELAFGPLNLGDGTYVFTLALYRRLTHLGESPIYDLLDRSYALEVVGNEPFHNGVFRHPASWRLTSAPERAAGTETLSSSGT